MKAAAGVIYKTIAKQDNISPDSPKFVLGDFNGCSLKQTLPNYYQYVTCPTRHKKTLDLCFGNIKDAYRSHQKMELGSSDHNAVHLIPHYKQRLKSSKPEVKNILKWSEESLDCLKGCFDCTLWDMFYETCANLEELNSVVSNYIQFCIDSVIPTKRIKVFPNDKPWMNSKMKEAVSRRKRAFEQGNLIQVKAIQKEIKQITSECETSRCALYSKKRGRPCL